MPQTIQQERAAFALEKVQQKAEELQGKDKERYKSYANALPFMIHANGLGQAAAFYKSKSTGKTGKRHRFIRRYMNFLASGWSMKDNLIMDVMIFSSELPAGI
ncbi:type III-B CRISPR module-associated protein Cmr5 [Candidatus Desantisbacteria bacterium CG2_30_40_21]|uniref:CRISPR type III-B/RAMP module-associated protein Cmr5 n=5 Tax=unclassified Candidatus Desantisiibacteriota TaxID=3106372 RepID=A0A2M7JD68_9BACT|nr:MAG: type III-B CRISPR module-associated protein Cmr5 [Candidatus Desantisbacteria bacterium CG2_30_40_21]PIP40195.1 MAG: type III-B CRISPR module-associated protein Cmr5 [Candidatus Desantisbacteria bacterium CG23_combo_of_CG06-09_8_20_14_all_40_23]PIX17362.1 MAG: type III-B CRISPR module-associated protein Cmr5 [Candidatus Desantisbacteria bacterium CG_4_8_14_3_um_filter_40_12]PIY20338.1 MAG: type III-B CRISPR module-associated protein Cmr5 [Candidatus Desantisbacteria bacterium CG_4_10_14_